MPLLAQIESTTILVLGGLVLTCGALLLRSHRQLGARPKTPVTPPAAWSQPKPPAAAHRLDAPKDVQRWEVEMHEVARELQARLDSKIGVLEQLIRDASQQTARLEAALERAAAHCRSPADASAEPPPMLVTKKGVARIDRAGNSASRRHAEIYSLADQGLTSVAIAHRVGSPVGEVELILGLREKA